MRIINCRYNTVKLTKEDVGIIIFDWITKTNDLRYKMNIEEKPFIDRVHYEDKKNEFTLTDYPEYGIVTAQHTSIDAAGIIWKLNVVFKLNEKQVYIEVTNNETSDEGKYIRKFRTPDIIAELIDLEIITKDGDIEIKDTAQYISNPDEIVNLMNSYDHELPIIYLSSTDEGYYACDPEVLASTFYGLAHVFIQNYFSDERVENVASNGNVAVYFPSTKLENNYFSMKKTVNIPGALSKAIMYYYKVRDYGYMTTCKEIASEALSKRYNALNSENSKLTKENNELLSTFDKDISEAEGEIEKLKAYCNQLKIENEILKQKLNTSGDSLLVYGNEKELYPNEIKEIIIDILEKQQFPSKSRREDVVNDILVANKLSTSIKQKHSEIKTLLSNYRTFDTDLKKKLESMGFDIEFNSKHYKLVYHGDARYQISLASTSSDVRSGLNAVSLITKNMM